MLQYIQNKGSLGGLRMKLDRLYMNKLYGGWMGKIIGVIHGANTEGWEYQKIKDTFGEITTYPFTYKNFCADDDINGPMLYIRALQDFAYNKNLTAEDMAHTLTNYVADGHGFFWWGGYGVSTEHTAYQNLMDGIKAPRSGSIAQNGVTMAEQIGGQIFADCWGFACPGDPVLAADLARKMASVTHDGNGVYGAMFVAGCIAKAYICSDIEGIITAGLSLIPEDCEYRVAAEDVIAYHKKNPKNWRQAFHYVEEKYGYQHYEGVCHIIPNAAVMVLAMLYGEGDYSRTINICNMCGWDTDCNVGNVGSVLGVMNGISGIDNSWLKQVGDFVCASGSLGYLNIQTVPQIATLTAKITHELYQIAPNDMWANLFSHPEGKYFNFEYPKSTCGMRTHFAGKPDIILCNTEDECFKGTRSLRATVPLLGNGDMFRLYYKTYYTPSDFDDSRYDPDFSPIVFPGDEVKAMLKVSGNQKATVKVVPYVLDRISGEMIESQTSFMIDETSWQEVRFRIPSKADMIVEEVGFKLICVRGNMAMRQFSLSVNLDEMEIISHSKYEMTFAALPNEKWNPIHELPAHLTFLRGIFRVEEEMLMASGSRKPSEAYTGNLHWQDYKLSVAMKPILGEYHHVLVRVQGGNRSYIIGLAPNNKLALYKNDRGYKVLEQVDFVWEIGKVYELEVQVKGQTITVNAEGKVLLTYEDTDRPYTHGCIGFGNKDASRTGFIHYYLEELYK